MVLDQAYLTFVDSIIARKLRGKDDIRMICLDTIDEFIDIFLTALCLRKGVDDPIDLKDGSGNGYTIVRKAIFGMLDKIHRSGMGWAIIAHTRTKTVRIGGEERQVSGLNVSDSFKGAVFQKCEHMLFVEHGVDTTIGPKEVKVVGGTMKMVKGKEKLVGGKTIEKPGKTTVEKVRKLKTKPGGLWQGGDTNDVKVRVPIADELILPKVGGWDLFTKAYEDAISILTQEKRNDVR